MKETKVSPSLLAADALNLQRDIEMINQSDADWLHFDVMDGTFVPNIAIGFPTLEAVSKICKKPLDVHLMVIHPEKWIDTLAACGVMMMNVHYEVCPHLDSIVRDIHKAGMKAAVTLNPSTPVSVLEDIITEVDMVLLMGVNPGFGGQSFIPYTYNKTDRLRRLIDGTHSHALIEVDGGVNGDNYEELVRHGVDVLVSGSYVFRSADPLATIRQLKGLE